MAEVGDIIRWDRGDGAADEIVVGYNHSLERRVDGLTEQQWAERELDARYVPLQEELDARVASGNLTEADRDEALARLAATINSEVRNVFGDIQAELGGLY